MVATEMSVEAEEDDRLLILDLEPSIFLFFKTMGEI